MTKVEEAAPAKVNLTLHVTGRRADGYHLLDSLVVFADIGDHVTAQASRETSLSVTGPRARGVPTDGSNLILRAAKLMPAVKAALKLDKHLPAASGIGGGSADAAACLRALHRLSAEPLPPPDALLALGADVPVCMAGRTTRMSGIGETLSHVPPLPPLPALLINPGVEVSTPAVFKTMTRRDNPPMPDVPALADPVAAANWLATQRNDLESPACALAPIIMTALTNLRAQPDCLLARMSGSGATCFGLFPSRAAATKAAHTLSQHHPDWWITLTNLAAFPSRPEG